MKDNEPWGMDCPKFRREQARIDCDIEGMTRDPELERLCDEWAAEGMTHNQIINRIAIYCGGTPPHAE